MTELLIKFYNIHFQLFGIKHLVIQRGPFTAVGFYCEWFSGDDVDKPNNWVFDVLFLKPFKFS